MTKLVELPEKELESIVQEYTPTNSNLENENHLRAFGRTVLRTVIRTRGQGDCGSVSRAISEVFTRIGVPHTLIPMEDGVYLDGEDRTSHAWVIVEPGVLQCTVDDLILDATAEQFIQNRNDVHVTLATSEFASNQYKTQLHQALRP